MSRSDAAFALPLPARTGGAPAALTLAWLALAGCEDRQVAVITLEGRPTAATTIGVYYQLDQAPAKGASVHQSLDQFGIELPVGTGGLLATNVFVYPGAVPCSLANGNGSVQMPGKYRQDLTIKMTPTTSRCTAATEPADFPTGKMAVWAAAPNDLWIVGDAGKILRWNGAYYVKVPMPDSVMTRLGHLPDLNKVWGIKPDDVWIVGDSNTILHTVTGGLAEVPQMGPGGMKYNVNWYGVSQAAQNTDVWFAASDGIWGYLPFGSSTIQMANPVCNVTGFRPMTGQNFYDIACAIVQGAPDCLAVGSGGMMLRTAPSTMTNRYRSCGDFTTYTTNDLYGAWAGYSDPSHEEFYVVGAAGTVMRGYEDYSVTTPQLSFFDVSKYLTPAEKVDFYALYGTGTDNVWFVGQGGVMAKWNYKLFSDMTSPFDFKTSGVTTDLRSVWGSAAYGALGAGPGKTMAYSGMLFQPQ